MSEHARSEWEGKLDAIVDAWKKIEILTVLEGVRLCAILSLYPEDWAENSRLAAVKDLRIIPLSVRWSSKQRRLAAIDQVNGQRPLRMRAVIAGRKDAKNFARAWSHADVEAVGRLLVYPECCCDSFVRRMMDGDCRDVLWGVARDTKQADVGAHGLVEIKGADALNILWSCLGVKPVPHIPCSLQCAPSAALARQFADIGRHTGYAKEVSWLEEVLRWPAEWSALHGIGELMTPILKASTNSEPTATKCTVRWIGDSYPQCGAQGKAFPFQQPTTGAAALSQRFTDGLRVIH